MQKNLSIIYEAEIISKKLRCTEMQKSTKTKFGNIPFAPKMRKWMPRCIIERKIRDDFWINSKLWTVTRRKQTGFYVDWKNMSKYLLSCQSNQQVKIKRCYNKWFNIINEHKQKQKIMNIQRWQRIPFSVSPLLTSPLLPRSLIPIVHFLRTCLKCE